MNNLLQEALEKVKSLSELEQEKIALSIIEQVNDCQKKKVNEVSDWDKLSELLDECKIETGISDLAEQHDHYIHGTPKRWENITEAFTTDKHFEQAGFIRLLT